ncbi:MAG: bifunctional diaminohydroxyphosphoribosylaminopyrimidine deaminase/5-amino-6-(5-phosphoribosylamino)uracil reductase RibD [Burkholderiaceae bacterium]|nr:bifunctional diaminohydroxyphosphoribosylaminopyrimidine deaminase/5-amino-6-(5-phosphoribosylamino)uracil reductase RibD [Burkholderiaceae bacterium]
MQASTYLDLALILAQKASHISPPNPAVGCVLLSPAGKLIGQGHTQQAGGPHAEVMALRDAATQGKSAVGATAYVTLEPCSHFGRTPPCCNALIDAKIGKVVVAILDPNPLVAGQGVQLLRAAGIEVEVLPPDHLDAIAARELNIGFFSRMIRQSPWVRMKIAASLDGKTALNNGASQWITSEAARADGHAWRARASAVLTGMGTVLADDPRLDVRYVDTPRQPHVVIVDSQLRTPPDARLFDSLPQNTPDLIATQAINTPARGIFIYTIAQNLAKQAILEARGATVIVLPDPAKTGKVDLAAMLRDLAAREVNELHVEAGPTLNGALIQAGLVDEFLVYLAPKLLGSGLNGVNGGRGMADFGPLTALTEALELDFTSIGQVGPDLRLLARVSGRDIF